MGFKPIQEGSAISAKFHAVHVLAIQGITVADGSLARVRSTVQDVPFSLAIGSSLNKTARELLDDDYTEDETAWAKEHSCSPPYALVRFGPTATHTCSAGYAQERNSSLFTYDAFSGAKEELRAAADKVLPSVITALACTLSSREHQVRLTKVDSVAFGITDAGVVVHDLRITMNATGTVAKRIATDVLTEKIGRATVVASSINPKVSRFYHLALEEKDPLKRFLYFFLAVEVETHATFARIDHPSAFAALVAGDDRTRDVVLPFLEEQREHWKTLRERFAWCVVASWTHLTRSDVEDFLRLKRVRDDIAHGVIATPNAADVHAVERLATLLHESAL